MSHFLTSVSGSKNLTSFSNRFFYFRRPSSLRLAFDAAKSNGRFGPNYCQKDEQCSSRGKRGVFFCSTVRIDAKNKVIQGGRLKKEGHLKELGGNQNQTLEAPSRCRSGQK